MAGGSSELARIEIQVPDRRVIREALIF
jgi:hypothetical protein